MWCGACCCDCALLISQKVCSWVGTREISRWHGARHTTPKTENTENNSEIIVIVFWILENNGDGDPDHPRVYPRSRAPDPEPRARAGNGAVGEAEKIVFVFVESNLVVSFPCSFHGTKKKKKVEVVEFTSNSVL